MVSAKSEALIDEESLFDSWLTEGPTLGDYYPLNPKETALPSNVEMRNSLGSLHSKCVWAQI